MTADILPDIDLDSVTLESVDEKPTRTRKPRSDAGKPRGRVASTKKLADELLVPWGMALTAFSMSAPTVAAVMAMRAEKTMDAVVSIASDHPRMLAALKKGAKFGPGTELLTTGAYMAIALMLDTGRLPREHALAMNTGLTQLYDDVHPSDEHVAAMAAQQQGNGSVYAFPGPPPQPGM